MANPWGDTTSLVILYIVIISFLLFLFGRLYKCLKRDPSNFTPGLTASKDDEMMRNSRNSSVDKIFNEFQHTVNLIPQVDDSLLNVSLDKQSDSPLLPTNRPKNRRSYLKSKTMIDSITKTDHINALLNLLTVKEVGDSGLKEDEMYLLKKKSKIFTHNDMQEGNASFNTTGHIEHLSKSFCMNNDLNIRNKPSCMFCLENVNIGDRVIYLESCKHLFHETCCCEWFTAKSYCPICKKSPFKEESFEYA